MDDKKSLLYDNNKVPKENKIQDKPVKIAPIFKIALAVSNLVNVISLAC